MHVREGTSADLPYVADIGSAAFKLDEFEDFISPRRAQYPYSSRYERLLLYKRRFYQGQILWVAVTDPDDADWEGHEVITGCSFAAPYLASGEGWSENKSSLPYALERCAIDFESWYRNSFGLNPGIDKSHLNEFLAVDASSSFDDIPFFWKVGVLAVSPDYQKRGIGSLLLQATMNKAAKDRVPVVLASTLSGQNFYQKLGFIERSRLSLKGTNTTWANLVWEPLGPHSA